MTFHLNIIRTKESILKNTPQLFYQTLPPTSPKTNDIWVSANTLIEYKWIGVWVSLWLNDLNLSPSVEIDIFDGNLNDGIVLNGNIENGILIDLNK